MPTPDWLVLDITRHFTPEFFRPYAEARKESFRFNNAVIEPGVFSLLQGWGRDKNVGIELNGCKLSRFHFEELANAPVGGLWISGCRYTEADTTALVNNPKLKYVSYEKGPVGDQTCEALATCENLEVIHLSHTKVTDAGLKSLGKLRKVQDLWLIDTAVTDKGIAELEGIKTLELLSVVSTKVTDTGIIQLVGLPKLRIGSGSSAITHEGLKAFKQAQKQAKHLAKTGKKLPKPKRIEADPVDVEAAKAVLFSFFKEMNQWERNSSYSDSKEAGVWVPPSLEKNATQQTQKQLVKDIQAIFKNHCTDKKRVYGRSSGGSYSTPPTYEGYEKVAFTDIYAKSKRKLVFESDKWHHSNRYQFVMVKKGDQWQIDHKKVFLDGWDTDYL